jgi:TRAP-type C4-dicarboxylate transport system permease small subunit
MAFICRMLRVCVGTLIAALVVIVAMGVIYRYALHRSLYWGTEVPNFILVWIVFLGAVVAFYDNKHIAFTLVGQAIGGRTQKLFEVLTALVILTLLVVLIYFGIGLVGRTMNSASEALKIPQGYIYACVPISAGLMAIIAVEHLVGAVTRLIGRTTS